MECKVYGSLLRIAMNKLKINIQPEILVIVLGRIVTQDLLAFFYVSATFAFFFAAEVNSGESQKYFHQDSSRKNNEICNGMKKDGIVIQSILKINQADRQTDIQTDTQTYRHTYRQTSRQADRRKF